MIWHVLKYYFVLVSGAAIGIGLMSPHGILLPSIFVAMVNGANAAIMAAVAHKSEEAKK